MKRWTRLFFYLVLNVLVSAGTTLLVLSLWPRLAPASPAPLRTLVLTPPEPGPTLGATRPASPAPAEPDSANPTGSPVQPAGVGTPPVPVEESAVEITAVIAPGVLQDERVVIQYHGEGELALFDWKLEDADGHAFTFPQLTLFRDGAVSVYTRAGVNNVVELYWGLTETVWQEGEMVSLLDPQGNLRAVYQIP